MEKREFLKNKRLILFNDEREQITGIPYPTWWRMEKAGIAPRRRRISPGRVGWIKAEVLDWIENLEQI